MAHTHSEQHRNYRFVLDSAELISGAANDGQYTLQGIGLGGTIKRGGVYIKYFSSLVDTASAPFARGTAGHLLKVKSRSFPLTDVQYKYAPGKKTINEADTTIAVMKNNSGQSDGTSFAFDNLASPDDEIHTFQNWNPSQGLHIEITNIDDSAVDPAHIANYNMEIVVQEYLEGTNSPGSKVNSIRN